MTSWSRKAVETAVTAAAESLGYDSLKPEQQRLVTDFVLGRDVFVSLPTGFGKSLCYGCLPRVFDSLKGLENKSIVVVVTPLIALMKDQVTTFTAKGLSAAYVSAETDSKTRDMIYEGQFQLIFIGPEQLLGSRKWRVMLRNDLYQSYLVGFVVDEAHLVKQWGDEFRKEFSRLGEVRSILPSNVNVLALTATAPRGMRIAIQKALGMTEPIVITASPDKPNIILSVCSYVSFDVSFGPVVEELRNARTSLGRTIIYCQKQEECANLYLFFKMCMGNEILQPQDALDLPQYRLVDMFMSSTHPSVKEEILQCFTSASAPLRIVICTIAFGMGVNPPDVRRIIHFGPPHSIVDYIQGIGRCGRDGKEAYASLLWGKGLRRHIENEMAVYCNNSESCRRDVLFNDFDCYSHNPVNVGCKCCDVCAKKCKCGNCCV